MAKKVVVLPKKEFYPPGKEPPQEGTPVKFKELKPGQRFNFEGSRGWVNTLFQNVEKYKYRRWDDWVIVVELGSPTMEKTVYVLNNERNKITK